MSTHIFSLYAPSFFQILPQADMQVLVNDELLVHRMVKVLRFSVGDSLILFDQGYHATVTITEISKKNVTVQVEQVNQNISSKPAITFLLPLLKKEALEQVVYSLCELGVSTIQLVITEKSRKNLMHDKEFERLSGIVIAAAEQSKHYAMSQLHKPKQLSEIVSKNSYDQKIVFDVSGKSFFDLVYNNKTSENIALLVGPEAGLTDAELQNLQKFKFEPCALTQTTLRAVQAVALGAGLFLVR